MKINFALRDLLIKEIPEMLKCYQCGTCVSGCPAEIYGKGYSPRRKILAALYGDKRLFNSELWKCATCNSCNERCPQEVNPYEVLIKLKNFVVRNKLMDEEVKSIRQKVFKTGYSILISERTNMKRKELGLNKIKPKKGLRKLLK